MMMEPILIEVPDELITQRLRLHVPRVNDGPAVAVAVRASLAELKPWMPWATDAYSDDDSTLWCRRTAAKFILREQIQFCIHELDGDMHIGNVGAHTVDWKNRACEVGYWLRTDRTGHGLMTEALNAVTTMLGTIGLRRIEVRCDVRNARSAGVARRCGFHHDGTLRFNCLDPQGVPRSDMVFSYVFDGTP